MINVTRMWEGGVFQVSMRSATENAVIRYTTDGTDPNEQSPVFSEALELAPGTELRARAYENTYHEPSDVASVLLPEELQPESEIPIGTMLNDGVIFYDRGGSYGQYGFLGDEIIRLTEGIDDGTSGSDKWRFLIAALSDDGPFSWGKPGAGLNTSVNLGYGLANTNEMIESTGDDELYWSAYILKKREKTGRNWFMPSRIELNSIIPDVVPGLIDDVYCSSSEAGSDIYGTNLITGAYYLVTRTGPRISRLVRRI